MPLIQQRSVVYRPHRFRRWAFGQLGMTRTSPCCWHFILLGRIGRGGRQGSMGDTAREIRFRHEIRLCPWTGLQCPRFDKTEGEGEREKGGKSLVVRCVFDCGLDDGS